MANTRSKHPRPQTTQPKFARLDLSEVSVDGIECKELRSHVQNLDVHSRKLLADVYREWVRQLDRNVTITGAFHLQAN